MPPARGGKSGVRMRRSRVTQGSSSRAQRAATARPHGRRHPRGARARGNGLPRGRTSRPRRPSSRSSWLARLARSGPAEPVGKRHPERNLSAPGWHGRECSCERRAHEALAASRKVNARRHRGCELDELPGEKRRARLERREHARAVGLHEHVVGQPRQSVQPHQVPGSRLDRRPDACASIAPGR